jgi:hypothetical protein
MRPDELPGLRQPAAAVFEFGVPNRPRVETSQEAKFSSAPLKPNGSFPIFLLPPQGGPGA